MRGKPCIVVNHQHEFSTSICIFGKSICKKSTLQSAGGHNAQYKGETNDPVKHENAKGREVSEIQDNIF